MTKYTGMIQNYLNSLDGRAKTNKVEFISTECEALHFISKFSWKKNGSRVRHLWTRKLARCLTLPSFFFPTNFGYEMQRFWVAQFRALS